MKFPNTPRGWLALALGVLALLGVTVVITNDGGATTVSVTVKAPEGPTTITAPAAAIERAGEGAHQNMDGDADVPTALLERAAVQQDAWAKVDKLPKHPPLAAPTQAGCKTRMVSNQSSRNGVKPRLWVVHYTVSPNRPGAQDIDALTAYASRRSSGVSWHFLMDRDGNCAYNVPEGAKAWTQATFNPVSISMEIINTGSERPLFTAQGLRNFARVVSDSAGRWGIPIRRGKVSGCTVVRGGIVDHNDLGACGGGHHDITPFKVDELIAAVVAHRKGSTASRTINYPKVANFGPKRRAWCLQLAIVRKNAQQFGGWTAPRRTAARNLKEQIGRGESRCRFV